MKSPMTQNQKGLVNYMNTVFIADDELIIRQGLKCIIDWESLGFSIIGEASNGIDALDYIVREQPDLVLMDIRMPGLLGVDVVKNARDKGFERHGRTRER